MDAPDTAHLRFCGHCLSRGWVLAQRIQKTGTWTEAKALCPTCSGLSVRDVDAIRDQAADEHWLRQRYLPAENRTCWDEYDWARERWADEQDEQKGAA